MTREKFLDGLCAGLRGLPQSEIDDIVSDYAAHFADALRYSPQMRSFSAPSWCSQAQL